MYLVKCNPGIHAVLNEDELKKEEAEGNCPKILGKIVDCTSEGATTCARHFYEGTPILITLRQAYGDKDTGHYGFFEWLKYLKRTEIKHEGKGHKGNVIIWNIKKHQNG